MKEPQSVIMQILADVFVHEDLARFIENIPANIRGASSNLSELRDRLDNADRASLEQVLSDAWFERFIDKSYGSSLEDQWGVPEDAVRGAFEEAVDRTIISLSLIDTGDQLRIEQGGYDE